MHIVSSNPLNGAIIGAHFQQFGKFGDLSVRKAG